MKNSARQTLQRLWDSALVLRFQAGDDRAFVEIVSVMQGHLRRYIQNVFHCQPADVEDLMQEVWMAACKELRRLREPASLRAWLYRITRNKALKGKRNRRILSPLDESILPDPTGPAAVEDRIESQRMLDALADLPPLQREAVLLRFEQGMTYEEIAAVADCPVGTVRSRLYHARQRLKQNLQKNLDLKENNSNDTQ